jgi:malate permease and related proteins
LLSWFQLTPPYLPRFLGRSLYWVGVPLQIFSLTRQSSFSQAVWLSPLVMGGALLLGLSFAKLCWNSELLICKRKDISGRARQGSYVLASMLGNVSFIGVSVVPNLVHETYWGWITLYSVTHTLLGSYGVGVFLASYFGRQKQQVFKSILVRDLAIAPSGWAFALGWLTRDMALPYFTESGLKDFVSIVPSGAFLLIGLQLTQLKGISNLRCALIPTALKILILPGLVGWGLSLIGISGDARLSLVLMSGMPTAFANIILAEEFKLDPQLAASCILLTTLGLPATIYLWFHLFG